MRTILLSLIALLPFLHAFAIPSTGLVHHFQLNNSLNSSSGTFAPLVSPNVSPQYGAGHLTHLSSDFAADFGGGRYLTITTDFTEHRVNNSYTVSAWFKPNIAPAGGQRFFVFETSPNYTVSLGLREGSDTSKTNVQFFTQTEFNSSLNISAEIPDREITARWHHAAITFDGTTLTAYIDGESIGTLNLSGEGDLKEVTALNIGTYRSANDRFFDGRIDEVAVWNVALTPSQIVALSDEAAITHYVNFLNFGLDAAPYNSWNTAAVDLQDALAIARPGDQIWIAQGNYYPDQGGGQTNNDQSATFTLKNRVAIYGGFQGGETSIAQANPASYPTILSGDIDQNNGTEGQLDLSNHENNSYHVLTAENVDATALLNGLTIKYGFAAGTPVSDQLGAGLYCKNASPTLVNLTFEANVAVYGAAIAFDGASPSIANSTFRHNTASDGGAFYALNASAPTITNSVFHSNIALDNGGVVFNAESTPTFINCAFYDNESNKEAGVFFNYDSNPILTNCTLYGNSSEREGGALYNEETSFPKLRNCIIWNNQADGVSNTADASIYNKTGSATVASNSLVENISKATLDASGTATNLEPTDPFFLSNDPVATANFQLRSASPAIDAGNNSLNSSATDLAGNPRIQNSTIDLGAVEGASTLHLYVKKDNAGAAAPYDSWVTAAATLQDALEFSGAGDEIWVAQGTYYPDEGGTQTNNDRGATFTLIEKVSLYGGFIGGETELNSANPRANETILSGDIDQNDGDNFANTAGNALHVATATGNIILAGFTVTGGNADSGTIFDDKDSSGAGLYIDVGFENIATVVHCLFQKNQAIVAGGGIINYTGKLLAINTTLEGNKASLSGGGISTYGQGVELINCVLKGNQAANGGAFDHFSGTASFTNCTIQGNRSFSNGGGIYIYYSSPSFKNCIIRNNQAGEATHTGSASVYAEGVSSPIYQYCLIENFTAAELNASSEDSKNNLDSADPHFVLEIDPATAPTTGGDLRLGLSSPAINAGDNSSNIITTDIAKNIRIQNGTIDLGAYETPSADLGLWSTSTPVPVDATSLDVTFTLNSGNLPNNWESSIEIVTFGQLSHSNPTFSNSGSEYTITLNNLSGEGHFTIEFEADDQTFYDLGFVPVGSTGGTFNRYTSSTPVHYVNAANATPAAPYDTWSKAAVNLQDALAYAAAGDDVWVAQGTYYPDEGNTQSNNDRSASFQLKNGVALCGGFAGDETDRAEADPQTNETILSGNIDHDNTPDNNSDHVVTARDTNNTAMLQGFTIEDGYAQSAGNESGGGLLIDNAYPTIKSCVFQNNQAVNYGGGIAIKGDAANQVIMDCVFIQNTAFYGGAIDISDKGLADFVNCVFKENSALYGGAISISGETSPQTWNCIFQGNHANNGGGAMYSSTTSHYTVGNSLFQGNQVDSYGGAVLLYNSSPRFVNSTFQGNQTTDKGGAIAIVDNQLDPTFENCIIWNNQANGVTNTPNASIYVEGNSTPTYSHCLVENYTKDDLDASGISPDTNLTPVDPRFILEAAPANAPTTIGDLRLRADSPAIDLGLNSANITTTDLAGNTRLQNTTIDLGPYEADTDSHPPIVIFDPDANDQFLTIRWKHGGVLQSSTNLEQWFEVTDVQSPLDISLESDSHRFWRLDMAE